MSDITIISHKRSSNFTIVPNHIINADYLKLEDKAFLIWVLSKPVDWKLNTLGLAKIHNVSKDKITGISKRLQKSGHLIIKKAKDGRTNWFIFEDVEDNLHYTPTTPTLNPHPENQSEPHPEKPDQGNQDALLRTDLLPSTDLKKDTKRSCASTDEHIEKCFDDLWTYWPAKKNKKASKKQFKTVCKGMASDDITFFTTMLKIDCQKRLNAGEYAFDNRNLEKHLKNELYNDEVKDHNNKSVAEVDEAQKASDAISRELFVGRYKNEQKGN